MKWPARLTRSLRTANPLSHIAGREKMDLEKAAAAAVVTALRESSSGDVLVFLPGAAEIRRTQQALVERVAKSVRVLPLYGALPLAQQDTAIRLDPSG